MAHDPRDPRGYFPGRNPFERSVINPLDLPASVIPRGNERASMPPGMLAADAGAQATAQFGTNRRTGRFMPVPFNVGVAPVLLIPEQPGRYYFFALNTSAVNRLFLGFDYEPNANNGVVLEINLGFYEPYTVPTNGVYVAAAGAGTTGVLIVAVEG